MKLHNGGRILEDVFTERFAKVGLSFAPWAGANAQPSWRDWSGSTISLLPLVAAATPLGSAWRLSKWRAYSSDPHRGACRSIDFGYSSMPGASKLQIFACELSAAYLLRSLRDPEGTDFFYSLVVPWLHEAWRRVQMAGGCAVAVNNPTLLHVDGKNIGLTVVCGFDVTWASGSPDAALQGGSHVILDAYPQFAVVVADDEDGVSIIGPYGRVLNCNLATLCGSGLVFAAYVSLDVRDEEVNVH
eukprot:2759188-Pleurochrysis_carterae.AAC.1